MNRESVAKWVAALRSGEYLQGRGMLANGGKYCCLGVACDLAVKDGVPVNVDERACCGELRPCGNTTVYFDDEGTYLPTSVMMWLGTNERNPSARYADKEYTLSRLNDDGAFSFLDIADIIERNYLGETVSAAA